MLLGLGAAPTPGLTWNMITGKPEGTATGSGDSPWKGLAIYVGGLAGAIILYKAIVKRKGRRR